MGSSERTTLEWASKAVFITFVVNGWIIAAWTSRIPGAMKELNADSARFSILLVCMALGAMLSMIKAGTMIARWGTVRVTLSGCLFAALGLCGLSAGLAGSLFLLCALSLAVTGMGMGVFDVAMNVEGSDVESRLGRTIMPRYHAGFSLGTVGGALTGVVGASLNIPIALALLLTSVGAVLVIVWVTRLFIDSHTNPDEKPARNPEDPSPWLEPRTVMIGVVVLAASLTEGAAVDWIAQGAAEGLGITEASAAGVFAAFVSAMTLTRWFGTRLIDRWGRVFSLRLSLCFSLVGLLVYVFSPSLALLILGAIFWGVGAALGFPLGISAASDEKNRAAERVGVVSFIAYGAFFVGPPLIGWLGHQWGVRPALAMIAVPMVFAIVFASVTEPKRSPASDHPKG